MHEAVHQRAEAALADLQAGHQQVERKIASQEIPAAPAQTDVVLDLPQGRVAVRMMQVEVDQGIVGVIPVERRVQFGKERVGAQAVGGVAGTVETVQAQPRQSRFDRPQRGCRHGRGVDAENQLHLRLAEQGAAHRAQLLQQRIVDEMGLDQNGDHGIQLGSDAMAGSTAGAGGKDNRPAASRPAAIAFDCRRPRQHADKHRKDHRSRSWLKCAGCARTDGTACTFPL